MQTTPTVTPSEMTRNGVGAENIQANRSLVISIHDVSTLTRHQVDRMLKELAEEGVSATSLLVIPDHHHLGRIDADPEFPAWLRDQVSRGHEAVLHGYYHLREARKREGVTTRLMTRFYTAGEGEFYDLSFEGAGTLLRRGRETLLGCGVETTGFIAPAWLLGAEAERAVRHEKFGYTTRIASVIDCREGRRFEARSMVYSVRAGWRRGMSLLWNEGVFQAMRNAPLLRIGIHPPDWRHEAIRHHILKCVRQSVATRDVTTYRDWVVRARPA